MMHGCRNPLPKIDMTYLTWNAAGLFGSIHTAQARNISKFHRFQRLVSRGSVVCIQESHGSIADLNTLDMECPSHMHWGSFGVRAAVGGVTTSISHEFANHFNEFTEVTFMTGRCLGLKCCGPLASLFIVNLHLDPILSHNDKTKLLHEIHAETKKFGSYTLLLGDFNFIHSDEARCNLSDPVQAESTANPRLASFFEEEFADFTECHQGAYTRRDTRGIVLRPSAGWTGST
jgi:exonuclease III